MFEFWIPWSSYRPQDGGNVLETLFKCMDDQWMYMNGAHVPVYVDITVKMEWTANSK